MTIYLTEITLENVVIHTGVKTIADTRLQKWRVYDTNIYYLFLDSILKIVTPYFDRPRFLCRSLKWYVERMS